VNWFYDKHCIGKNTFDTFYFWISYCLTHNPLHAHSLRFHKTINHSLFSITYITDICLIRDSQDTWLRRFCSSFPKTVMLVLLQENHQYPKNSLLKSELGLLFNFLIMTPRNATPISSDYQFELVQRYLSEVLWEWLKYCYCFNNFLSVNNIE
jgi:hypothetical protein